MLFAGLQGQTVGRIAQCIDADADDTAGHLAFVGLGGGEVTGVRATESHRQTEALVGTEHYVGTPFAGRRDEGEAEQVGGHGHLHSLGFPFGNLGAVVDDFTELVRALDDDAEIFLVGFELVDVVHYNLDALEVGAGLDDLDALREQVAGHEELLHAGLHLGAAARVPEHQHGFGGGGAFVEQAGVGQRQGGEVADDGLVVHQSLQTALRNLGLIGSVRGVPAWVLKDVTHDDARGDGVVVAQADVAAELLVLRADGLEVADDFVFAHAVADVEVFRQADLGSDDFVDKLFLRLDADDLEHLFSIRCGGAVVAFDEVVSDHI